MTQADRKATPDWEGLEAAGLYDPASPGAADRRALLEFLTEQGCSLDEMVRADARGRLFALAGDRIIRPGHGTVSLREIAERSGADVDVVRRAWRAWGLPDRGPDELVASPADAEVFPIYLAFMSVVGEDASLGLARVVGNAMGRVGEAASVAVRASSGGALAMDVTGSEEQTARAFVQAVAGVPAFSRLLDLLFRHHLEAVREQFEASGTLLQGGGVNNTVRYGVGFADLSGFTSFSEALPTDELGRFLSAFEEIAQDTVVGGGGRIVKFIGDAVMFVAPSAAIVTRIADALVNHPAARHVGIGVRAGIDHGTLLAQDGDYFGPTVNLASRLVGLAEPGHVLAGPTLAGSLDPATWQASALEPTMIRGFTDPVTAYRITRIPRT